MEMWMCLSRSGYRWNTCVDAEEVSFFNHHIPLVIDDTFHRYREYEKPDNIIAALEHNDRGRQIDLKYPGSSSNLDYVTYSAAMQKPFPELTDLWLGVYGKDE